MRSVAVLVIFLVVAFAAAAIGAAFPPGDWYAGLVKPSWNPPSWLFAPVWTALYVMMAVTAWLVWRQGSAPAVRAALFAWVVQLALNAAWSWLFFGLHRPGLAFAELVVLWLAILVTVVLAWRVAPTAGALLLPYLAWVTFAGMLNVTLWRLNA
jgi:translocator protein